MKCLAYTEKLCEPPYLSAKPAGQWSVNSKNRETQMYVLTRVVFSLEEQDNTHSWLVKLDPATADNLKGSLVFDDLSYLIWTVCFNRSYSSSLHNRGKRRAYAPSAKREPLRPTPKMYSHRLHKYSPERCTSKKKDTAYYVERRRTPDGKEKS